MLGTLWQSIKQTAIQKGWVVPVYNSTCHYSAVALSKAHYLANQCSLVNPFTHPELTVNIKGTGIDALSEYMKDTSWFTGEGFAFAKNMTNEYVLGGITNCMNDPSKIVAGYIPSYEAAIMLSAVTGAMVVGGTVALAVNCCLQSSQKAKVKR